MITGFNSDVESGGAVFHVQTEDKGAANPVVETLVYLDGQILAARRTPYCETGQQPLDPKAITALMETQHQAMVADVSRGRFGPSEAAGPRPRKIVVVDDDPDTLSYLEMILTRAGYQVAVTARSKDAIDLVRREKPNLVLCDVTMPEPDGYGVIELLQSDPSTARFPVAFLTGRQAFDERVRAFRFGVVDFITKPFKSERLLQRLNALLPRLTGRPATVRAPVKTLMREIEDGARSGVLTIESPEGTQTAVVRAGRVIEGQISAEATSSAPAEFEELDLDVEEVLAHDPSVLSGDVSAAPGFERVPEPLRVVLLVDDNPVFRGLLCDVLNQQGFQVLEANDGVEGLEQAVRHHPWLIVADTRMPHLDGFEMCRRARRHICLARTPFIFLSGWDDYEDQARGLRAGADEYVSKHSPVRMLLIRILLALRRYTDVNAWSGAPISGRLDVLGVLPLLRLLHLARRTGVLTVRSENRLVEVRMREGEIVGADSDRLTGSAALLELLGWTYGEYDLTTAAPDDRSTLGAFESLMETVCKALDQVALGTSAVDEESGRGGAKPSGGSKT